MAECNHEWQLTETGYTRTWHTEVDPETKTITATYTGSEAFSESGAGDDHLACIWCGAEQSIEGWEVDWQ
ncbi:hypothetical protein SEA_JOURNEY13_67 [Mycobacterium phage Journey13]|nr:hypothetical protein SEA_JOURNEY13_67 [Mycobacterium phage Journey13]